MMKTILILTSLFFCVLTACKSPKSEENTQATDTTATLTKDSATHTEKGKAVHMDEWEEYTNNKFHFNLQYPPQWHVVEEDMGSNMPIINVYSPRHEDQIDLPLDVHAHAEITHVSFFPKGWGTELPSGDKQKLQNAETQVPVAIDLNREKSTLFSLENGAVWGYFLIPASTPAGWSKEGYLFAQIAVDNFQTKCFDEQTNEEKDLQDCDPLMGDRIERYGTLNEQAQTQVRNILTSIQFTEEGSERQAVSDLIQVETPLPNEDVQSPLTVKGQARGMWYFEAEFKVLLKDKDDNVVAQSQAIAQGPWMTEDFVPFEATLRFDPPNDEQGTLVLQKANPSGMAENEQSYSIPVHFPPEK